MIEQRVHEMRAPNARSRIALVGLRGAGKSTLGKMLAEKLGYPFVELNRVVEQEYGASVSMLIEMSGVNTSAATSANASNACSPTTTRS